MELHDRRQLQIARAAVLLLLVVVLGALKAGYHVGDGPFGLDASNYLQTARHVMNGDGLLTSVSLYYEATKQLPGRSPSIYPLWPLLLGWAGRVVGLYGAADLLPKIFYILDLLLAYLLGNRLLFRVSGREALFAAQPLVTLGHVMVLLLGTNELFFKATSFPYTEGVAFGLMFGALLAADAMTESRSLVWPLLAGLLAGLALLSRTQMVVLCFGLTLALVLIALRDSGLRPRAALFLFTLAIPVAYWYFGIYRTPLERADVERLHMWVTAPTAAGFVSERWRGLVAGFHPFSPWSYFNAFGAVTLIPLLALVLLLVRRGGKPSWQILPAATLLCGLGFFASLNLYHQAVMMPWFFGYRHGLPYLLLIWLGFAYVLARGPGWLAIASLLLAAASIATGGAAIVQFVTSPHLPALTSAERQTVAWLDAQPKRPTVMTTHAQELSAHTPANFHWALCEESEQKTVAMLRNLPIDYVLAYEEESGCRWLAHLARFLRVERAFGEAPHRIFVLVRQPG